MSFVFQNPIKYRNEYLEKKEGEWSGTTVLNMSYEAGVYISCFPSYDNWNTDKEMLRVFHLTRKVPVGNPLFHYWINNAKGSKYFTQFVYELLTESTEEFKNEHYQLIIDCLKRAGSEWVYSKLRYEQKDNKKLLTHFVIEKLWEYHYQKLKRHYEEEDRIVIVTGGISLQFLRRITPKGIADIVKFQLVEEFGITEVITNMSNPDYLHVFMENTYEWEKERNMYYNVTQAKEWNTLTAMRLDDKLEYYDRMLIKMRYSIVEKTKSIDRLLSLIIIETDFDLKQYIKRKIELLKKQNEEKEQKKNDKN